MSNRPGSPEVESIMKRYAGRVGSEAVSTLTPGENVFLEMPHGDIWIRDSEAPVCLVAGSTGIAPILGMLRRLAADHDSRPVGVVYGANVHDELVCWQDLAELVVELADAELIGALTTAHEGWSGVEGLVTHALEPMLDELASADFYVVGPPVMNRLGYFASVSICITTALGSVKNSRLKLPPSRPMPESPTPPNGARRSRMKRQFTQTVPAVSCAATR